MPEGALRENHARNTAAAFAPNAGSPEKKNAKLSVVAIATAFSSRGKSIAAMAAMFAWPSQSTHGSPAFEQLGAVAPQGFELQGQ